MERLGVRPTKVTMTVRLPAQAGGPTNEQCDLRGTVPAKVPKEIANGVRDEMPALHEKTARH